MGRANYITAVISGIASSLMLVSCSAAPASSPPGAEPTIETVQLKACPEVDPYRECEYDLATIPSYLPKALEGDYQAQRNVAASFASPRRWVVARPIQACAWRMVIEVTKPADAEYQDTNSYGIDCRDLSQGDLAQAEAVAGLIHRRIHGSDLPALPPIPA